MLPLDAQPNAAHRTLARWEQEGKLLAVVTQNIDGLHQKAGSQRVYELHGSRASATTVPAAASSISPSTSGTRAAAAVRQLRRPHQARRGALRGDPGRGACIEARWTPSAAADLLIVGGTSLTVYPAAGLLRYYRGQPPGAHQPGRHALRRRGRTWCSASPSGRCWARSEVRAGFAGKSAGFSLYAAALAAYDKRNCGKRREVCS